MSWQLCVPCDTMPAVSHRDVSTTAQYAGLMPPFGCTRALSAVFASGPLVIPPFRRNVAPTHARMLGSRRFQHVHDPCLLQKERVPRGSLHLSRTVHDRAQLVHVASGRNNNPSFPLSSGILLQDDPNVWPNLEEAEPTSSPPVWS